MLISRRSPSRAAWLAVGLLMIVAVGWAGAGSAEARPLLAQCQDNVDNDGDGERDYPDDPGCGGYADASEAGPSSLPACADNRDNDNDGKIDFPAEPGCQTGADNDERNSANPSNLAECSDREDNDDDGLTDYPADPGCGWASEDDELNRGECSDGIDNDGDGRVDWRGQDFGCLQQNDADELDPPQCNDGRDNDGDAMVDYEGDSDCTDATDAREAPDPACSDGRDNDGDGKGDFPADPGCSSPGDGDETDTVIYALPGGPAGPGGPGPPGANSLLASGTQARARPRLLSPFPIVRLRGSVRGKVVRVILLSVRAPRRSKVSVYCTGRSCPRRRAAATAGTRIVRMRQFERRLRGGTILKIYVTKPGFVGKYTRFRFVSNRAPLRTDRCATSAGTKPKRCPASS